MTTTTVTEPERASESKQPSVSESDGLKRLSKEFPNQVEKILRVGEPDSAGEGRCDIWDVLMHDTNEHGWACLADVAEFIENWEPDKSGQQTEPESVEQLADGVRKLSEPSKPTASSQRPTGILTCIDRLRTLCPDAFKEAVEGLGAQGFWPAVLHVIERQVSTKGYGLLADMLEFGEAWQSGEQHASVGSRPADDAPAATPDLTDIRERVKRIGGLVNAASICEHVYSDTCGTDEVYAVKDFCDAIAGSINAAARELDELRRLLNGTRKGGVS